MAATNTPMKSREAICAAYTPVDAQDEISLNVMLDMRDLLNRISMVASEGKVEIIEDPEVKSIAGEQMEIELEDK